VSPKVRIVGEIEMKKKGEEGEGRRKCVQPISRDSWRSSLGDKM
jgi:hypothetical protein